MRFARWIQAALALWFLVAFVFLYGWAATKRGWFPAPQVDSAQHAVRTVLAQLSDDIGPPYRETTETRRVAVHDAQAMAPDLTLITGLGPEGSLQAQLIRPDGTAVHTWDLTSFRLWPDPQHIPAEERPKQRPGTVVHGIVLSVDGGLVMGT